MDLAVSNGLCRTALQSFSLVSVEKTSTLVAFAAFISHNQGDLAAAVNSSSFDSLNKIFKTSSVGGRFSVYENPPVIKCECKMLHD